MSQSFDANRWKRFDDWDERSLRLDKFAVEDPENGFSAFSGAADPKPGLEITGGKVTSVDGIAAKDFDMIDAFIDLKNEEIERLNMTTHPVEFDMYYSV